MHEIQIEELSEGLKTLVCEYQNQIQPFAMDLTSNLLSSFWEIVKNSEQYNFTDDV